MPEMLTAARAGFGLAYLMDDLVQADVAKGRLTRVLADWCPPFSGYHLYIQVGGSLRRRSPYSSTRCASRVNRGLELPARRLAKGESVVVAPDGQRSCAQRTCTSTAALTGGDA